MTIVAYLSGWSDRSVAGVFPRSPSFRLGRLGSTTRKQRIRSASDRVSTHTRRNTHERGEGTSAETTEMTGRTSEEGRVSGYYDRAASLMADRPDREFTCQFPEAIDLPRTDVCAYSCVTHIMLISLLQTCNCLVSTGLPNSSAVPPRPPRLDPIRNSPPAIVDPPHRLNSTRLHPDQFQRGCSQTTIQTRRIFHTKPCSRTRGSTYTRPRMDMGRCSTRRDPRSLHHGQRVYTTHRPCHRPCDS